MEKAFKQPLFVTGIPLAICGFCFGISGLFIEKTFAYMAPGLLIPGLIFMLIGWMQRNK
ncbi:hypothetical protein [Pseudomonas sp. efr-133-TYG-103a]|nr:hypothetical protein [Pseudomonas sp. efr-133-TYG-103a]